MKLDKAKQAARKLKQIRYCERLKSAALSVTYSEDLDEAEIDKIIMQWQVAYLENKIKALLYEIELL